MDYAKESLRLHGEWKGKIEMVTRVPVKTKDDLALAYTPGVAQPCLEIQKDPSRSYELTRRWNTAAVITDGSAVLGLGDIGPEAGMPVMEGKCVLFKAFGDVDALPICVKTKDVDEFVETVYNISGSFGGINLEDIAAPRCFEIERKLKEKCDIPIFHDDQHGTAVITLAGLTNALKVVGKKKEDVKIVTSGAGAAAIAITKLLLSAGFKDITMCDRKGAIYKGREGLNWIKTEMAEVTNLSHKAGSLADMLVGAGTVITLEQCKKAVACGAKFIVAPGYSEEVVSWCVENDIAITPGCVTPTEIMAAMSHGLKVVKFFPANVYGGLSAMKALSGPFGGIKFIPTGGVNDKNLAEYISAPFIHAVGGSWLCAKADIAAHNFDKITSLCKEARKTALGFEIAHVGVNAGDAEESLAVCRALDAAFGFGVKEGNSSNFAGSGVEVMKSPYLGKNGHIAVKTNSIPRAAAELARNGFTLDESTAKYKGEKMVAVYLKQEFGGFAVHLLQK